MCRTKLDNGSTIPKKADGFLGQKFHIVIVRYSQRNLCTIGVSSIYIMTKVTIVIPTYNERENIGGLIEKIFEVFHKNNIDGNIIVVDDNSPDGTSGAVEKIKENEDYPIELIERPKKLGIGSAYISGFKKALELDSDVIFEMDADLSHDPDIIPEFIENLRDYDVILGSRYVDDGKIENWGVYRKAISRGANIFADMLLNLNVKDITAGYRAYKREVLQAIDLRAIRSDGYSFQVEMLFKTKKKGFRIKEIPIIFRDRSRGKSKLSKMEVVKFFILCFGLFVKRLKFI